MGDSECTKCGQAITGKAIKTKDDLFHEDNDCFCCTVCDKDLKAAPVYNKDHKLYCEKHYKENFVPKCNKCNDFIMESCVRALDVAWHKEHFNCHACNVNFTAKGLGYHQFESHGYCEPCFNKTALKQCQGCDQPIKDKALKALGNHWHVKCLTCQDCETTFEDGKSFYSREGSAICGLCAGVDEVED